MTENEIGTVVIEEAIDIHRALGPGLLESTHEEPHRPNNQRDFMRAQDLRAQHDAVVSHGGTEFTEFFCLLDKTLSVRSVPL